MSVAAPELPKLPRAVNRDSLKPGRAARGRVILEKIIGGWIYLCGLTSVVLVLLIFLFVFREAFPLLREYPLTAFLLGKEWRPTDDPAAFGLVPLLLSSLLVTAGAILISVPLGISTAVFIGEIAPRRLREVLKITVELLASVPSVVLGFFGLMVLGPILQNVFKMDTGTNMLAGSITLAFMAIPTIATISEDALSSVSRETREGSLGLGATRWQTICGVSLPAAAPGIVAATMLGVGRAIGETMVVLMVTGNGVGQNLSILMNGPRNPLVVFQSTFASYGELCRTLTATIAAEMGEVAPGDSHYHALFLLGVVLFLITFLINFAADFALRRTQQGRR
ncbi:MAG: phosphate ABC transporter permease subunit PstC [Armatimonadota bacterium]